MSRIKFEGRDYLETSEGGIKLGDLKIATGIVTALTQFHRRPGYTGRFEFETEATEISAKYYREVPLTFEEWLASAKAIKLPDISRALREAFEAGQRLECK